MNGYFITGTDTNVGKTWFAIEWIKQLQQQRQTVTVMKPVASGGRLVNGVLRNDDALQLITASGLDLDYEMVNPYCFKPAIAPHIVAEQIGVTIEIDRIVENAQALARGADQIVVEGVGGWRVPLAPAVEVSNLAQHLNLPVILVVGMRLGCLNHALLTAEAISRSGCQLIGWVASHPAPDMNSINQILETLREVLDAPYLGHCRHQQGYVAATI